MPTSPITGQLRDHIECQTNFPPEVEEGNVEYKLKLYPPNTDRFEHLVTQLKWRLTEFGECWYEIGVDDDGMIVGSPTESLDDSLNTLKLMCDSVGAHISHFNRFQLKQGWEVAEAHIRPLENASSPESQGNVELRIAFLGDTNSGKSTLLSVLSRGILDNGCGGARVSLLRHRHELLSGKTSSAAFEVVAYEATGLESSAPIFQESPNLGQPVPLSLQQKWLAATKIVQMVDLAGHVDYQRTTLSALTNNGPDMAAITISAKSTILSSLTLEYLRIIIALKIRFIIIFTKVDLTNTDKLAVLVREVGSTLRKSEFRPILVDKLEVIPSILKDDRVVPIFLSSSVTGEYIGSLHRYFALVPQQTSLTDSKARRISRPFFVVEQVYSLPDIGFVICGSLQAGILSAHEDVKYYLGPDATGSCVPVNISSIHRHRIPVGVAVAGQIITLAVTGVDQASIRKGMVLVDVTWLERSNMKLPVVSTFEASLSRVSGDFVGSVSSLEAYVYVNGARWLANISQQSGGKDTSYLCTLRNGHIYLRSGSNVIISSFDEHLKLAGHVI